MAQFDVFRAADDSEYVVNCQSDLLRHLNTRFVVPLMPLARAPRPAAPLNPLFEIDGEVHAMVTQFAASIPATDLKERICSLADRHFDVTRAIDTLMSGV